MRADEPPTERQIHALAAALCDQAGEQFPPDRGSAAALIERLRRAQGHPTPALTGAPPRSASVRTGSRVRDPRRKGTDRLARAIADELIRELRRGEGRAGQHATKGGG